MIARKPSTTERPERARHAYLWVPPLVLIGLVLLAAPLYGQVMAGLLWMGQTVRALCGF